MKAIIRHDHLMRLLGVLFMSLWVALALSAAYSMVVNFEDYQRYLPKLWSGTVTTLQLVGASLFIGMLLSLPIALARLSHSRLLNHLAYVYIYVFRGTPLIAQTFLLYYGAGGFNKFLAEIHLWWFFRDPFNCVLLVFSLNTAAYQAEILRGAIQSVPRGQIEAGHAIGLRPLFIFFKITLPQALIIALRPYGNEVILMIKGSAIAAIITVFDLMGETRRAFSRTLDYNLYLVAALIYLSMVEVLRHIWAKLEQRLTRHLVR